jgi:hypothetical protein
MITIQNIIEFSKEHPSLRNGRITRIGNNNIEFSIVGGTSGLYGDFINDFEVAIFDKKNNDFITKFFHPDASDDVMAYMSKEDLEVLINKVLRTNDFQVR